jgi:hypothetical protein
MSSCMKLRSIFTRSWKPCASSPLIMSFVIIMPLQIVKSTRLSETKWEHFVLMDMHQSNLSIEIVKVPTPDHREGSIQDLSLSSSLDVTLWPGHPVAFLSALRTFPPCGPPHSHTLSPWLLTHMHSSMFFSPPLFVLYLSLGRASGLSLPLWSRLFPIGWYAPHLMILS